MALKIQVGEGLEHAAGEDRVCLGPEFLALVGRGSPLHRGHGRTSSGERGWTVIMAGLLDWAVRMRAQPFAHWVAASLAKAA